MKLSLKIKIAAPIVLFVALVGALGAYFFIGAEREILYRELERDRSSLSELIATQLAAPVKLDNLDRVNNILNGLRKRPGIVHASVWCKGASNAVFGTSNVRFPDEWKAPSDTARSIVVEGMWMGSTPIKHNGQTLGELSSPEKPKR